MVLRTGLSDRFARLAPAGVLDPVLDPTPRGESTHAAGSESPGLELPRPESDVSPIAFAEGARSRPFLPLAGQPPRDAVETPYHRRKDCMNTQVAILHRDYPSEVRDNVERKLQQLGRFFGRAITVRANLERQHDGHRVELIANVGRGSVLVADFAHENFGAALDEAIARMERQLKKHHDKVTIERYRGGRSGHVA